jgi:hypothetical protein
MKILISYDFLTTQANVGKQIIENLDFLNDILTKLGLDVTLDNNLSTLFPIQKFFKLQNQPFSNHMVNFIQPDIGSLESKELVTCYLGGADLLIAYELSEQTRDYFNAIGVSYIDIWLSPLRFCKDVLFAFHSNVESFQLALIKNQTPVEFFSHQAKELSDYCQNFLPANDFLEANSALVIGQLLVDKACQNGNEFLNLVDFKEKIQQVSKNHKHTYILKHPLMPDQEFTALVADLGIENLIYLKDENVYELMSNSKIITVVAVSSSVLKEAFFFGKKTVCLYKTPLDDRHINIYQSFFKAQFWSAVLGLKNQPDVWSFHNYDNFLRFKFDAFYAYKKFVRNADSLSKIKKTELMYSALINLSSQLEGLTKVGSLIFYGFGTIGELTLPFLKTQILGIIDKDLSERKVSAVQGIPIIKIRDLKDGDTVLICAFKYHYEIKSELVLTGKKLNILSLKSFSEKTLLSIA